jgi:uncharacterized Zn ribbon protein
MKSTCPKCGTTYDIARLTCKRCGYEWQARGDDPSVCAKCKSPYWNKDKRLFKKTSAAFKKAYRKRVGKV